MRTACIYISVQALDVITTYTVLDKAACSSAELSLAQTNNNPAALLRGQIAAEDSASTEKLAAMKARLDAVKPLLTTLSAEAPASLIITGLDPSAPVVWMGAPYQICYRLQPSANVNPKKLYLVLDDGKGSYYSSSLGNANALLPTTYQGCLELTMSTGLPISRYFIEMRDSLRNRYLVRTDLYQAYQASVGFAIVVNYPTYISVRTTSNSPAASPTDVIKVINSQGTVVYWYYTSTSSQTTPEATTATKATSYVGVKNYKLNAVPGGYKVKYYPKGGDVVAAVGRDWISWSKFGL